MNSVKDILNAMRLAPSAHNTQPWKFDARDHAIDIYVDWDRHLGVSDPDERQLYISIGCALENGRIAAESAGNSSHVAYFPEGEEKRHKPVARIRIQPDRQMNITAAQRLHSAIPKRRNDRTIYDGAPLEAGEREALATRHEDGVVFIEDEKARSEIAELSAEGTENTLSRTDFKGELSEWVRSSITKQHDGMPGDAMGMPAPIALFAPWAVRTLPVHKMQRVEVRKQIESAAALAVIGTQTENASDKMYTGQILERLWLEAVSVGLAASVIAAPVESGADLRNRFQQTLGIDKKPQMLLRIGHSTTDKPGSTPRRTLEEVLIA